MITDSHRRQFIRTFMEDFVENNYSISEVFNYKRCQFIDYIVISI